MDWYRWLWSRTLGRPFTYVIRDIYHQAEWLVETAWFFLGFTLAVLVSGSWTMLLIIWGLYTFGYTMGHIDWGTPYIPYQQGNGTKKKPLKK